MNPIPASLIVGAIVVLNRWTKGDGIAIENVLGVAGIAVTLGVLNAMDAKFARTFGTLVVVAVALALVPGTFERLGFTSKGIRGPKKKGGRVEKS